MSSAVMNVAAELLTEKARNASQHLASIRLPDKLTVTKSAGICEAF